MCSRSGNGGRIEAGGDFGYRPAAPGFAAKCVPRDVAKRLRNCIGDERIGWASRLPGGCVLRECFDQGHTERPDVGGCGERRGSGFGSVVSLELARCFAGFTDGEQSIAGKFELIGDGENIGRFDPRMNEAIAVEVNESIEYGFEHFASFGSSKRALRKNLGEVFFGMLHHHEETIPVFEAAAADVEDAEQMRMRELHHAEPESELEIGGGTSGNKFDRRFLRLAA